VNAIVALIASDGRDDWPAAVGAGAAAARRNGARP